MSEQDARASNGNGSADPTGGQQIVAEAIAALDALGDDPAPEAVDQVIITAIENNATDIERAMIGARLPRAILNVGITRKVFEARWRQAERVRVAREREERQDEQSDAKRELTEDEAQQERERLYVYAKPLLDHPNILDAVADVVDKLGAAGVRAESKVIYLAGVSALLQQPLSIDVNGPSSVGKSYLVRKVLTLFPAGAKYEFTSVSAKAFFYTKDENVVKHKIVNAGEATAFYAGGQDGDDTSRQAAAFIRQLQSEGGITHLVPRKGDDGRFETEPITREGPISLIVTSTQDLHAENATRNLLIHLNETSEQTRLIIDKRMAMRIEGAFTLDLDPWHALNAYLSYGPIACVVPYARELGRMIGEKHLRIRRDIDAIITAIEAHALLNQARREQDEQGRWIATLDDYAAIQPIFDVILAHGREDVLNDGSRRLHAHIIKLIEAQEAQKGTKPQPRRPAPLRKDAMPTGTLNITTRQLAGELGISEATIRRQLRELYDLQLTKNMETRPRQALQLQILAALPDARAVSVLPHPEVLAAAWESAGIGVARAPLENRDAVTQ
jgi:hypothetical protein